MTTNWTHIAKRIALLMIVPLLIGAFIFVNYNNKNSVCKAVAVHLQNGNDVQFVTVAELTESIKNTNNIITGTTLIKNINCKQVEANVVNNPWVKSANIFIDHHDVINVDVVQKMPVVRWLNGDLIQSYLDAECNAIPVNSNYSANVPLVTSTKMGSTLPEQKIKSQVVALCKFIQQDTFWNAVVTQINIDSKNQFELIPNIGDHTILFGDTSNMANKFARLLLFYKDAMPREGFSTYHTLDVKNDGQIVAIKADSMYVAMQKIRLAKLNTDATTAKNNEILTSNTKNVTTALSQAAAAIVINKVISKPIVALGKPKPIAIKPNVAAVKPKVIANKPKPKIVANKPKPTVTKESDRVTKAKNNLKQLVASQNKLQAAKPKKTKPPVVKPKTNKLKPTTQKIN